MSETIDRANRLASLQIQPGFSDLWKLSLEISNELTATAVDYPGWDLQQLLVLKARAQAAKEHHERLFLKLNAIIHAGIEEQAAADNPRDKSIPEIIEQSDYVRLQVLTKFEEMDAEGLPGTYSKPGPETL